MTLGHARRCGAEIVSYADDLEVRGSAPSAATRATVEPMMERLRLPLNATKTRCGGVPAERLEFLGKCVGRNYNPRTGIAYIGTCPNPASVRNVCRNVGTLTEAWRGLPPESISNS